METNSTITENNTELNDDDLLKRLHQQTEVKEPTKATVTPEEKKSFWDFSDDDFEQNTSSEKKPIEAKGKEKEVEETETATEEKPKKISEKLKLGSATTAVGMLDFTAKLLITPIHTFKVKKKIEKAFTKEQFDLLESKLIEAEETDLDKKELSIKKKFDSIMEKYQKKVDKVPMDEAEKQELKDAFYNYFDYTETTLSPNWYLAMAITNSLGGKLIDAFTD